MKNIIDKIKTFFKRLIVSFFLGITVFLLFKSGTVYVDYGKMYFKIGIDIGEKVALKEPYMPYDLDAQLKANRAEIEDTEKMIQEARDLGIIID